MNSPTIVILSVVLGFLTCSDANLRSNPVPETPSQVVGKYVSFAHDGEFKKVESLVISSLKDLPKTREKGTNIAPEIKKDGSVSEGSNDIKVVPDESVFAGATRDWITGDFAKSIHDDKLSIKSVKNEIAKDAEARVEIILGNEKATNSLGWVFLLRKVDEEWKIYDITTAGAPLESLK